MEVDAPASAPPAAAGPSAAGTRPKAKRGFSKPLLAGTSDSPAPTHAVIDSVDFARFVKGAAALRAEYRTSPATKSPFSNVEPCEGCPFV